MRGNRQRWIVASTCLLIVVFGMRPPLAAQPSARDAVVTAAVQVTANPAPVRAHSSPKIAVNPRNKELAIVESDPRGKRGCEVHLSVDDGRSWAPGGDPMMDPYRDCSFYGEYGAYASMAFDKKGTLYIAFIASEFLNRPRDETPRHVFLARSDDGGRSFTTTMVFKAPDGDPDRGLNKGPTLAIDPTDPRRVYVGWRQGIFVNAKEKFKGNIAASADGGRTFGAPVDLYDERGGDYPWPAVGQDGTVHVVYWTRTFPPVPPGEPAPVRPLNYARSTDHGKTWSRPEQVDPGNQVAGSPRNPVLAADPNSQALYMVWYSDVETKNQAPGFQGNLDIFFRHSPDGGKTWSERQVLNDDAKAGGKVHQFDPGIAIAPDGRVDVAWYDGRLSPRPPATGAGTNERGLQDVYYTSSTDQGRTWRPNLRISDRSIDRSIGVWGNNIGSSHNIGIASTADSVYFAWQEPRVPHPEQQPEDVYMSSLKLDSQALSAASKTSTSVPWAVYILAGIALGMGAGMIIVWAVSRRTTTP